MASCSFTFLDLLLVCVVWGAWLHCIKGDCGEIRRIKFYPPDNSRYLEGHVFLNRSIGIHRQCEEQCLLESECVSVNIGPPSNEKFICELSNSDHVQHPQNLKQRRDWTYKGIENLCVSNPCVNNGKCLMGFTNKKYLCVCKIGFTGENCENVMIGSHPDNPAYSCKHIRDNGISNKSGEYWIDPERNGNPLKVYCDMTTDGGGWLLVSNVVIDSSTTPPQLSIEFPTVTKYRAISGYHSNNMVVFRSAMKELRAHLPFTQLRFYCSKQKVGRTFHVITTANSSGEAVVQYFSGQTDVLPDSCGSFVRMKNDNSRLAQLCDQWGTQNGSIKVGKWSSDNIAGGGKALYHHPAFVPGEHYWLLNVRSRWECDDFTARKNMSIASGDFWKVFVR